MLEVVVDAGLGRSSGGWPVDGSLAGVVALRMNSIRPQPKQLAKFLKLKSSPKVSKNLMGGTATVLSFQVI